MFAFLVMVSLFHNSISVNIANEADLAANLNNKVIENCQSPSDLINILSRIKPTIYQIFVAVEKFGELDGCDGTELLTIPWQIDPFQDDLFEQVMETMIHKTTNPAKFFSLVSQLYSKHNQSFPEDMMESLLIRAADLKDCKTSIMIHQQLKSANFNNHQDNMMMLEMYALNNNASDSITFLSSFSIVEQQGMISGLLGGIRYVLPKDKQLTHCNELIKMSLKMEQFYIGMTVFYEMNRVGIPANFESFQLQISAFSKYMEGLTNIAANTFIDSILRTTSNEMLKYSSNSSAMHEIRTLAEFDIFFSTILYGHYGINGKDQITVIINCWSPLLNLFKEDGFHRTPTLDVRGFHEAVIPYLVEHLFYYRKYDIIGRKKILFDLIILTDSQRNAELVIHVLKSWNPPINPIIFENNANAVHVFARDITNFYQSYNYS